MDEQTAVVMRTKDYDKFKSLAGNRELGSRPDKIMQSIKENGYILNPIIVNENYEVADGQGRLEALRRLKLPVDYVLVKGLTLKDCIAMNAKTTPWKMKDYIDSYIAQGNDNYRRLKKLMKDHKVGISAIQNIVIGAYGSGKENSVIGFDAIKQGKAIVSESDYMIAERKLTFIDQFLPIIKKVGGKVDYWCLAIAFLYDLKEIDNDRLIKQVTALYKEMTPAATIKQAIQNLEEVYNYKARSKCYAYTAYDKMLCEKNAGYKARWGADRKTT